MCKIRDYFNTFNKREEKTSTASNDQKTECKSPNNIKEIQLLWARFPKVAHDC